MNAVLNGVGRSPSSQSADGFLRIGVPIGRGGTGGQLSDAVEAITHLAERAPAAALQMWAQRVLIECLLHGDNVGLCEYQLTSVLDGTVPGTTGLWRQTLSLRDREAARVTGRNTHRGWRLSGRLAAMPNVGPAWYVAAIPVAFEESRAYAIALLSSEQDRIRRIDAVGPPGSHGANIATLELDDVHFREDELIAPDGPKLVGQIRTVSVALRCGMLVGQARTLMQQHPELYRPSHAAHLSRLVDQLLTGVSAGSFTRSPFELLAIHLQLVRHGARRVGALTRH